MHKLGFPARRNLRQHRLRTTLSALAGGVGRRHLFSGQQQRVTIARALASEPDIVLADEPTINLDSKSGAEVLEVLRRACDTKGQTTVMVTHDPRASFHADRVVFLRDGEIVHELQDGRGHTPQETMDAMAASEN